MILAVFLNTPVAAGLITSLTPSWHIVNNQKRLNNSSCRSAKDNLESWMENWKQYCKIYCDYLLLFGTLYATLSHLKTNLPVYSSFHHFPKKVNDLENQTPGTLLFRITAFLRPDSAYFYQAPHSCLSHMSSRPLLTS